MGYIWGGMVIAAFFFGIANGQLQSVAEAALSGAENAVTMAFSLLGMMCFWSGMLEIAKRSGLTDWLARLIRPLTKILFPKLSPDSPALRAMVMNMTANFLGLSNAATPLGLAAMHELDKINPNKDTASDEMCMFVVINTASISLLPTTVITMRAAAGSIDPFSIILPVWICSICSVTVGVIVAKYLSRRNKRRRF